MPLFISVYWWFHWFVCCILLKKPEGNAIIPVRKGKQFWFSMEVLFFNAIYKFKDLVAWCHSFWLFWYYILHTFNPSHSNSKFIHRLSPKFLSISSLGCRAENLTRACLTASQRTINWATPQPLTELRRTLTELRRALTELRRTWIKNYLYFSKVDSRHLENCFRVFGQIICCKVAVSATGVSKKRKVVKKSSCFEVLDVLFWGLEASSVAWTSFMEA